MGTWTSTPRGSDPGARPPTAARVELYWLPLGAGQRCVRGCGRTFEALAARRDGRPAQALYHAALEVRVDGQRYTIEMAPAWGTPGPDRGVTGTGPVGLRWLGRSRFFRYEVRCWLDGVVPDLDHAVGGPARLHTDTAAARRLLAALPDFPTATWGRDELRAGEMWNSNSLVAWALHVSGHETTTVTPPPGGRAPGWAAGLVVAGRRAPFADVRCA